MVSDTADEFARASVRLSGRGAWHGGDSEAVMYIVTR